MGRLSTSINSQQGGKSSASKGNYIGFDQDSIMKEFERAFNELKSLANDVEPKEIRSIQRASLRPMVDKYKANIKSSDGVIKVYRNGGVYAEIRPDTLKKSIGIISHKVAKKSVFSALSVGPRVKGSFSDPDKGGWFAHFVEHGFIDRFGNYIKSSQNFGFAEKSKQNAMPLVRATFVTKMRSYIDKKVKEALR